MDAMGADGRGVVGAVFARGGSKGVPRKCLREVGGRSLLEIAIGHAQAIERVDRVIVSTDDPDYAAVAESAGAEVPFLRPTELSSDTAKMTDVIEHAIKTYEDYIKDQISIVILLDCFKFTIIARGLYS